MLIAHTDTSLSYSWSMSFGASSYHVSLILNGYVVQSNETTETAFTFDMLNASSGYLFSVLASNGLDNSSLVTDSARTSTKEILFVTKL